MTIVCITPQLAGWAVEVDREADAWYEADVAMDDGYALLIYPKPCWEPVYYLTTFEK